jgi:hypothetical protein
VLSVWASFSIREVTPRLTIIVFIGAIITSFVATSALARLTARRGIVAHHFRRVVNETAWKVPVARRHFT